jgi:cytoskeletal protein RodZ
VVALVLVAIIALTALVLSVWLLVRPDEEQTADVPQTVTARVTVPAEAAERAPASGTPPAKRPASPAANLLLTAARGDCWLEARVSSATGKLLFTGNLEQGRSIRLTKTRRLWVAFGAGANLDVTLNGRRVEGFPTGTAAVVVTAKGVSAPTGI